MSDTLLVQVNNKRVAVRQIDELIGLARGICADGEINQQELEFLHKWLAANIGIRTDPLIMHVFSCVESIMADGIADPIEREEILHLLNAMTRNDTELGEPLPAANLPLCDPAPDVIFLQKRFCFTGTFCLGTRSECESVVASKGGTAASLTKNTDYLVIGDYATESWKHSTHGNKILKAMEMRASGVPVSIISEKHFRRFLEDE